MSKLIHRTTSFFIRISAFIAKDMYTTLSQPRLLGILVLGPFLILLVFGISYQNTFRTLRTLVVVSEGTSLEQATKGLVEAPLPGIEVVDLTSDTASAFEALERQEVDLVLVAPLDALQKIEANKQAVITFFHQEIDPFEVAYVEIVADQITRETNRQLMVLVIEQNKEVARAYQPVIHQVARSEYSTPVGSGPQDARTLGGSALPAFSQVTWLLLQATGWREAGLGPENHSGLPSEASSEARPPDVDGADLQTVDAQLEWLLSRDSQVIVEPFRSVSRSLSEVEVQPVHFYVPAVIALLLQHLAISLAGLSIVTERFAGTMELMRAAPVSAFEVLAGKYLSYLIFTGVLAAALTGLVHWGLGVPLIGHWLLYALSACLVIVVSLGIGFLISQFTQSESQAVQLAMVLLLGSIFFSGFFLPLYRLQWPAKAISWMLPSTYGMKMLQDIMLRGIRPELWLFWVLGGLAVVLFSISWVRMRSLMVQE